MRNTAYRRFTCRYWALGPSCPDGVRCVFAHRDTGELATPTHQPGTCLVYNQLGDCYRGTNCGYEHRNTGVTGLYQGTIQLVGFELQIADIAYNAGFDTQRHESLFDLIWAVKRVALRMRQPRPRPPPHPIYPDRYRPDGVGDNTNKKRKRVDNVRLKFNPVPALMQKGGTKEDPIALDSEDEKQKATQAPNKKLKNATGIAARPPTKDAHIANQILKVKGKLEAVRRDVKGCVDDMKVLFDDNKARFDDDEIMKVLESLAEAMNKADAGATAAEKTAEKGAAWITFGGTVL